MMKDIASKNFQEAHKSPKSGNLYDIDTTQNEQNASHFPDPVVVSTDSASRIHSPGADF